jgi:hypothetical protein
LTLISDFWFGPVSGVPVWLSFGELLDVNVKRGEQKRPPHFLADRKKVCSQATPG